MKKKMLSLALALAMCLGLTAPAFAAENNWDLAVNGESDTAAWMKEKTFTLRSWSFSDYDENDMRTATQIDAGEFTINCLCPSKGDVMGITNGGERFYTLNLMAWSDPDGDGVYDNRLMKGSIAEAGEKLLPADIAGPLASSEPFGGEEWYFNYFYLYPDGSVNGGGYVEDKVTELRLPVDKLLDEFGSNTLVWITVDGENGWYVFVEDDGSQPTTPAVGNFTDVKTSDYFAEPVQWAVEKGVTAGTSATTFSPNADCTQGQILTFLWRAKGEPKPAGAVSGTEYYAAAAQWAKEQGLTDNFSAEADCTRAMVVTYLWKLAGSPKTGTSDFTDVPANADYAQAVAWALEQGVTAGTSATTFSPDSVCTRGQIVCFLYRALAE